jgi:hypothetical protein
MSLLFFLFKKNLHFLIAKSDKNIVLWRVPLEQHHKIENRKPGWPLLDKLVANKFCICFGITGGLPSCTDIPSLHAPHKLVWLFLNLGLFKICY